MLVQVSCDINVKDLTESVVAKGAEQLSKAHCNYVSFLLTSFAIILLHNPHMLRYGASVYSIVYSSVDMSLESPYWMGADELGFVTVTTSKSQSS